MNIYVYWIHYPNHTNPKTEGYIGVSKQPSVRMRYHSSLKYSDNSRLYRCIQKGAMQSILFECSTEQFAYQLEESLRPHDGIGWNMQSGGTSPPSQLGKNNPNVAKSNRTRVVSQETKQKMSEKRKGKKWFTDGTKNVRRLECPEGFYPGKTCKPGWWGSKKKS